MSPMIRSNGLARSRAETSCSPRSSRYLRARELAHETRVLEDLRLDDEKKAKDEKSGRSSKDNVLTISANLNFVLTGCVADIPTRQVHSRPYPHASLSSVLASFCGL